MRYSLLGSLTVTDGTADAVPLGLGGFRQRAVLAVLLLSADRTVDVDILTEQVWDESPPPKPIASIRAYVANLRRILADDQRPDRLVTDGRGYRLQLGHDELDIRIFETQVGQGKRLLEAGDAVGATELLGAALTLWRGAPLDDFRDLPFAHHEVHRLEALRSDAVEARYEAELLQGHSANLISGLQEEVATNPLRERLWAHLMLAQYRAGRRADALVSYQRLQAVLNEELGIRPTATLERLAVEIRSESDRLQWAPPSRTLYGRAPELLRLRGALTAVADGRGSIAVVTGDSGVGKTALASEVARMADDLGIATVWVGHAGGVRPPPTWAWTQVLRTLSGTSHALDGAENNSARTAFTYLENIASTVVDLAGRRPTLIVLDDLHRADRTTRDVLELLGSALARVPLLILATWPDGGTGRPVHHRDFDRMLSRSEVTLTRLHGLGNEATAQLISNVSGVTPTAEFVGSMEDRTGGNPFYIKELTRLLRDNGQLDGGTRVIASKDVPDAVSGVIRSRMAILPRPARSALAVAALMGTEFRAGLLADVLGTPTAQVLRILEPALRSGLVTSTEPDAFRFSHGLVRDAVAAQVIGTALSTTHADIARTYALRGSATVEEAFAGADHAWRAGAELDTDTALALLDRAVAAAWARSAYREVANLSNHALEITARLADSDQRREHEGRLWLQLVSVQAVTSGQNSSEVRHALRRLREISPHAGQFTLEAAFRCLEASGSGRYREAAALAEGLITVHHDTGDLISGSAGYYLQGLVEFFGNALASSSAALDKLLALPAVDWQRHGHLSAFDVRGYGVAAWIAAVRGDADAVDTCIERGVALGRSRNDLFGMSIVRISALQAVAIMGRVEGTAEMAREVYTELTELGINQLAASARIIEGWAAAMTPGGPDSSDAVRSGIEKHTQDGTRIFLPMYYLMLSDTEVAQGRWTAAQEALESARTVAAATGERVWDGHLAARLTKLQAAGARPDHLTA